MSRAAEMIRVIRQFENLRPSAFAMVCDPDTDIKVRWVAFDQLTEHALTAMPSAVDDHRFRQLLAMTAIRCGGEMDFNIVLTQAELLAPTEPNRDTGKPQMSIGDTAILGQVTGALAAELPESWHDFYNAAPEDVPRRKAAFRNLYRAAAPRWVAASLFAEQLPSDQRQGQVLVALMVHLPRDLWTESDLIALESQLLPVEE